MYVTLLLLLGRLTAADPAFPVFRSCEDTLAPTPAWATNVYDQTVKLKSGSELFLRLERPAGRDPKKNILLVHGVFDSHRQWDAVAAELLRRGYAVARPDLRGFMRSLHNRHPLPAVLKYTEDVRDLGELIQLLAERFAFTAPRIAGHSRGGGLLFPLLAGAAGASALDQRHLVINPFVYDLHLFEAERYSLVGHQWTSTFMQMFMPGAGDRVLTFLKPTYAKFLKDQSRARGSTLTNEELRQAVDRQVEVGVGVIKGLDGLDCLRLVDQLPDGVRVDEAFGTDDPVVPAAQARQLGALLEKRGGVVTPLAGKHWLPTERPVEITDLIVDEEDRVGGAN